MYTGSWPSLSLSDSNACPYFGLLLGASHSLENTRSPAEFIRPLVHWENGNIVSGRGVSMVQLWFEVLKPI